MKKEPTINPNDFVRVKSGTDEVYVPLDGDLPYNAREAIDDINGEVIAGTLEDKVDYLGETKEDIREAIIFRDVSVSEDTPFRSYADKIREIGTIINNQDKNITENGQYVADEGYTGLGEVNVNVETSRYGITFTQFVGMADNQGVLQAPANTNITLSGFTDVGEKALFSTFAGKENLLNSQIVLGNDITSISGYLAMYGFVQGSGISKLIMSGVRTISGDYALQSACSNCRRLTEVRFDSLESITGENALYMMLANATSLMSLSFPMLTNVSQTGLWLMLQGCQQAIVIHFRQDAQSTIEGINGYSDKFGATNGTILFDLPNI